MRSVFVTRIALCCALAFVLPAAAYALDLPGALQQAAASNPAFASRRDMVEAARQRIAPAGAWSAPMAEVGLANVPLNGDLNMDPMTMRMFGLQQRVPVSGANGLARAAARRAYAAEGADAQAMNADMFGMVIETYAEAYEAGELARTAEAHRGVMDRMVASARVRYDAGRGRLDEVLRAEAERARMLADVAMFRAEADGARARLDALLGRTPGASTDTLAAPAFVLAGDAAPVWADAIGDAHPKLRALSETQARYALSARAARRMAWPDLDVRASYEKRGIMADGMRLDDMFSASVGVMLPVFSGSRERAMGAEMDAMARAAASDRRAAQLDLSAQLIAARASAHAAARTVGLLADTVIVAQRRALDATWASYEAGSVDLSRVVESAHALYGEHVALVRARQDYARACARLVTVTARGDEVGLALPEPEGRSTR